MPETFAAVHAAIDAARELRPAHGILAREVAEIRARSFDDAADLFRSMSDTHARGGPERPFSIADTVAKFMEFAVRSPEERRAAPIRDATGALAEPDRRLAELSRHLHAA